MNPYSDEQALQIYDESVRMRRAVRSELVGSLVLILAVAGFLGLLALVQTTQSEPGAPRLAIAPADDDSLATAYAALLAVVLAVWFSPSAFRFGGHESPATIAREIAAQRVAQNIARLCVHAALVLALWSFVSRVRPEIDFVHDIVPVLVGLGLSYWAAWAAARIGEIAEPQLLRAEWVREQERLSGIVSEVNARSMGCRSPLAQSIYAFVVVPVCLFGLGMLVQPVASAPNALARLAFVIAVTIVAYWMLADLVYRLIGRETWVAATNILAPMLLAGTMLLLATVSFMLPSAITPEAIGLEPLARAILLLPVISISGPFLLLGPLVAPLPIVKQDGLIFRRVLRRYRRALYAVERQLGRSTENGQVLDEDRSRPVAWAGLFAFVPVFPFNVLFAASAFKLVREHGYRGRTLAWIGLTLGALIMLAILGLLGLVLVGHLSLVGCSPDSQSVCIIGAGR